jgi:hypothetical protein
MRNSASVAGSTLPPARSSPSFGQAEAVFGGAELEALHGHRAQDEPVVAAHAGFDGQRVRVQVVALSQALLPAS